MRLGYTDPQTKEFVKASSVQLRNTARVSPDEATRRACFEGASGPARARGRFRYAVSPLPALPVEPLASPWAYFPLSSSHLCNPPNPPQNPANKNKSAGTSAIGPHVAERFLEIVRLRNALAVRLGFVDFYDYKARARGVFEGLIGGS